MRRPTFELVRNRQPGSNMPSPLTVVHSFPTDTTPPHTFAEACADSIKHMLANTTNHFLMALPPIAWSNSAIGFFNCYSLHSMPRYSPQSCAGFRKAFLTGTSHLIGFDRTYELNPWRGSCRSGLMIIAAWNETSARGRSGLRQPITSPPPGRSHDMIPAGRKSSAQRAGQKFWVSL
jgi:hypothetical protein